MNKLPESMKKMSGKLRDEYELYRRLADDGKGGDSTRNGKPLLTFDQWLES